MRRKKCNCHTKKIIRYSFHPGLPHPRHEKSTNETITASSQSSSRGWCDGHQMALLTPDLPQRPGGLQCPLQCSLELHTVLLSAPYSAPYSAGSHFSLQSKSFALLNLTLTSDRWMGAGFGEVVVPVNLRQKNKPPVKSWLLQHHKQSRSPKGAHLFSNSMCRL